MHIDKVDLIENINGKGLFSQAQLHGAEHKHMQAAAKKDYEGVMNMGSVPVTKNVTYGKPEEDDKNSAIQNIMDQAANLDAVQMKNEMVTGTKTVTADSARTMEEEDGFSLRDTDVHTVVTETDKIQMQLAKSGADTSYFTGELSPEQIEQIAGSAGLAAQYEAALAQAQAINPLSEGAVKYMLDNELEPTIANLYLAQYNGASAYVNQPSAIFDDAKIAEGIERALTAAGLDVTEQAIASGKWLAANEIPVTPKNLKYMNDLQSAELPPVQSDAVKAMTIAAAEGKDPADGCLLAGYSAMEQAEQALQVIEQTTDDDIRYVIEQGQELTISNLEEAHQLLTQNAAVEKGGASVKRGEGFSSGSPKELMFLEAKRKLEETRLTMTIEANYKLIKRGMEIDTRPLAQLVEDLKNQEQSYYRNLIEADGSSATDEQIALFAKTVESAEQLKYMPAYALGSSTYDGTVESLHEAGRQLQQQMDAAGQRYETMMTAPRADLSDNIQKAFRNIGEILDDIGMEQSETNERAVRILAYNSIEITEQSVLEMKLADKQVQQAFDSLKPAVVREMIREGKNPLQMNIHELNEYAAEIRERIGGTDELTKYSEYLWKLEQNQAISPEERDSYIGIYRLIHQVEAGDGAAIGALVQQGAELTMGNLLMAVRSAKKGSMDYKVDQNFDGVNGSIKGKSITDQINAAYELECFKEVQEIAKEPEQFGELLNKEKSGQSDWQQMTPEQLLQQIRQTPVDETASQEYYKQQLQELEQAAAAPEQIYRLLESYDMTATVTNVLAMQQMMSSPNEMMKRLFGMLDQVEKQETQRSEGDRKDELLSEIAEIKDEIMHKLGEHVQTPEELADAQQTLADVAEHCGQTFIRKGMTTLDIRQYQMMTAQLHLGMQMTKEERYQIPILTSDGAMGVNVRIVRGSEKKGSVRISMDSSIYGKVTAEMKLESKGIRGYIVSDSRAGAEQLTQDLSYLEELMTEELPENAAINELHIVFSAHVDLAEFELAGEKSILSENEEEMQIQTKQLYGIAEKMLRFFREGLEKSA